MVFRLIALMLLAGCAAIPAPAGCVAGLAGPAVWLVDRGWHTELFVPAAAVTGPLAATTGRFAAAPMVAFGFGKRDWITAEQRHISITLAGPMPGPGVVEVTGSPGLPAGAIRLALDASGMAGLQAFLAASLADPAAPPVVVSRFGQHFHDASRSYSLAYTCNTWVAEALAAAGLPVRAHGVRLTRSVLAQAARAPQACGMMG